MKKIVSLLLVCLGFMNAKSQIKLPKTLGGSQTITINTIPASTEEFIQLRDQLAKTPEGAAAILVVAAIKYTENPKLGRHWLIIATDKYWLSASSADQAYKGFDLGSSANFSLKQLDGKKYIPFSYIKGTSVTNGYTPSSLPYKIAIERTADGGDGNMKVFVVTSGADTARPVTLKKNDAGVWKGFEYSSLFVAVKQPVAKSRGAADGDF